MRKIEFFYEVEGILDSKRFGRTVKYRVRWKGYGEADDTWQPTDTLLVQMDMRKSAIDGNGSTVSSSGSLPTESSTLKRDGEGAADIKRS